MGRAAELLLIGFYLLAGPAGAAEKGEGFTVYTEESPPYNFEQDGKIVGIATEMLEASCQEAGLRCPITLMPWARAYHNAVSEPNSLIYTTTRTPERETGFLWIGPILPRDIWLFVRRSSGLKISSLADLAGLKVGVPYDDALVWEMRDAGVPESALDMAPSFYSNVLKLLGGRIDIMPATDIGMDWTLHVMGRDRDLVRKAFFFGSGHGSYFAINPNSDPARVERLRQAWSKVAASPLRAKLIEKYLSAPPPDQPSSPHKE